MTQPHAYLYNNGGLNNQKMALLGLFLQARDSDNPHVILPDLFLFDQTSEAKRTVHFADAFVPEPMQRFAASIGVDILPGPATGEAGGWDYFGTGSMHIGSAQMAGTLTPDDVACEFFRHLVPRLQGSPTLERVARPVFAERDIRLVAQLRIENDWKLFSQITLEPTVGSSEDYAPSFTEIVAKIRASGLAEHNGIYVVCDEAGLPVGKEEIRDTVLREFGIAMVWKSDLLTAEELGALSVLDLSILDFEIAVQSPSFVGLTRSSFSNLVSVERYARQRAPVTTHYIYNLPGPQLGRRTDNGAFPFAQAAIATP